LRRNHEKEKGRTLALGKKNPAPRRAQPSCEEEEKNRPPASKESPFLNRSDNKKEEMSRKKGSKNRKQYRKGQIRNYGKPRVLFCAWKNGSSQKKKGCWEKVEKDWEKDRTMLEGVNPLSTPRNTPKKKNRRKKGGRGQNRENKLGRKRPR